MSASAPATQPSPIKVTRILLVALVICYVYNEDQDVAAWCFFLRVLEFWGAKRPLLNRIIDEEAFGPAQARFACFG